MMRRWERWRGAVDGRDLLAAAGYLAVVAGVAMGWGWAAALIVAGALLLLLAVLPVLGR